MKERPCADWLAALEAANVPCGPINDIGQLFADPHAEAHGLRVEIPDTPRDGSSGGRTLPGVASPMRFSRTPVHYELPPPRLGQHTEEVLREELGMSESEIARVRASGALGT